MTKEMACITVVRVLELLLVMGFIPATSAKESGVTLLPTGWTFAFQEHRVLFTCNTTLSATYPLWIINGQAYKVTSLPKGITADGFHVLVTSHIFIRILCLLKYFSNGTIHYSYSNTATVFPQKAELRNIRSLFPVCTEKNTTLLIHGQVIKIYLNVASSNQACNFSATLSSCSTTMDIIREELQSSQTQLVFSMNEISRFYGTNVTVTINKVCDDCRETQIYIPHFHPTEYISVPNGYTGIIIEDLSNDYCDFNGIIIDYKICLHTQEISHCFENLCGSEKVYATDCNGFHDSEMVGLAVNGAENGTVVSIFCLRPDCVGKPSYLMAINFVIIIENVSRGQNEKTTRTSQPDATTSVQRTTETMMESSSVSSQPTSIPKNMVSVSLYSKPALTHTIHLQDVYLACGVLIPLVLFVLLITTLVIILYCRRKSKGTNTENAFPVYEEVTSVVKNPPVLHNNAAYGNTQRVQLKDNPAYLPVITQTISS